MTDKMSAKGIAFFRETMGEERAAALTDHIASGDFGAPIGQLALDYAFGSIWSRDGLARRDRSLLVIGMLIAQRQSSELKNHIRIGIANGLVPAEIEEALIQAVPYCGFPAVASATTAAIEVLRELGLETSSRTSQERGLL
jgi:4-carboxymuconolactone decarboxylase